jgi:pilus assembly protein FimV
LSALQEETTAREKSIKESGERVAALDKQLQDMQKLMEIKNKSLADAQKSAKAPEPAKAEPPKVEPPKPAPPVVEPPKVKPPPAAPVPPPAPVAIQEPVPVKPDAAVAPESPKPQAKPAEKKPKKIVHPAPPPPMEEPGIFAMLQENMVLLVGGGGLLALIGGAWMFLRNKRRKGLDSFEQGILSSGGLKPNTAFGNNDGSSVDTGNSSFLTDFGQGNSGGMIDTSEVDPIAEAEVYLAYGRDVQAEEIL